MCWLNQNLRIMRSKKTNIFRGFDNTQATMWIPIRLLISIAVITFFTGLIVIGSQLLTETVQRNGLKNDLREIKQTLESLYYNGDSRILFDTMSAPGSTRVFNLEVPQTITSIYFGKKQSDPSELSSSIRFQSEQGERLIWMNDDIELISGVLKDDMWYPNDESRGLSLCSGNYQIIAELVSDNSHQFVLLYVVK